MFQGVAKNKNKARCDLSVPQSLPDGGRTGITDLVVLQVKLLEGGVVPAETTEHTKRNERSRNRCATPQKVVNTAGSGATPKYTVIVGTIKPFQRVRNKHTMKF
jgi:hypothetical protein